MGLRAINEAGHISNILVHARREPVEEVKNNKCDNFINNWYQKVIILLFSVKFKKKRFRNNYQGSFGDHVSVAGDHSKDDDEPHMNNVDADNAHASLKIIEFFLNDLCCLRRGRTTISFPSF